MADGLYVAASGAVAQLRHLDVVANNLANASTPGFQPDAASFGAVLAARAGAGATKHYVELASVAPRRVHGPIERTGNPLDVAIRGDAYLRVSTPRGQRLTRDGRLLVGPHGVLETVGGYPVLGADGQPIVVPPGASVEFGRDGTVVASGAELGRLDLVALPPGQLAVHDGDGLLRPATAAALVPAPGAEVVQGFLERSAADPVHTMVQLVEVQRSFDAVHQVMRAYRQMDDRASNLARVG